MITTTVLLNVFYDASICDIL